MRARSEPPPGRAHRARLATVLPVALLLSIAALPAHSAERLSFPLAGVDPTSGRPIRVQAGAPALHLVFFATWCTPCLDELHGLERLEARWGDRGYRLVLIAVPTRQSEQRLAQLVERRNPPGQVAFDASGSARDACGVRDLPTHLVIDASGRVVLRAPALDEGVEAAVAGLLRPGGG